MTNFQTTKSSIIYITGTQSHNKYMQQMCTFSM